MAEVTNYTNPLGGNEVVADVLAQIKKRLSTDCNLRATDGYSGGYAGTVTIKLKLHAVRISEVEMEVPISQSPELKALGLDAFPPEDVEPVELNEEIEIPLEPNLDEVRERTVENNLEPDEKSEPVEGEDKGEEPESGARTKRKYTRRTAVVAAVTE